MKLTEPGLLMTIIVIKKNEFGPHLDGSWPRGIVLIEVTESRAVAGRMLPLGGENAL